MTRIINLIFLLCTDLEVVQVLKCVWSYHHIVRSRIIFDLGAHNNCGMENECIFCIASIIMAGILLEQNIKFPYPIFQVPAN